MMIKEPTDATTPEAGLPTFESTLVIAFPDVLQAGPKILLSSAHAASQGQTVTAWSHYSTAPISAAKISRAASGSAKPAKKQPKDFVHYSTAALGGQTIGQLTVSTAPATTEQASFLCQAIVHQAKASGTQKIIIVAASNVATKQSRTHVVQLHQEGSLGLPALPKDVSLGDHILNTLLALLTFIEIPTTALVHPAKKGTSLRETRSIIENLTASLALTLGEGGSTEFSAERAFEYRPSKGEDEEAADSMMYL
ncbi:hypothetical protein EMPS_08143 [Entomortierella parvispora]|uniref:Uncharacterized protein n=1 Tax=Entomortierella parvispora TaxID=205924 RepID=A0A9P3HFU7_9FUNG|nr:hypothetical protein EMPS_08143 [Entomortierella parvispora]